MSSLLPFVFLLLLWLLLLLLFPLLCLLVGLFLVSSVVCFLPFCPLSRVVCCHIATVCKWLLINCFKPAGAMDWVALRQALLVFQTCSPLDNPGRLCSAKTADMANAACVSFSVQCFDSRGSESTWSEDVANLGGLVFYNALQAPL